MVPTEPEVAKLELAAQFVDHAKVLDTERERLEAVQQHLAKVAQVRSAEWFGWLRPDMLGAEIQATAASIHVVGILISRVPRLLRARNQLGGLVGRKVCLADAQAMLPQINE